MGNLPNAENSPRIVNGVLKWYQGDTFDIQLELDLKDQDGEDVIIGSDDTVKIVFFDKRKYIVKEFIFTDISENTVTLDFDAECSALFLAGSYTYDIYYAGSERTTVAKNNKVLVETNGDYAAAIPPEDIFTQLSSRITAIEQKEPSWDSKGTYSKPSGGIPSSDIADGAIVSEKIPDSAVTGAKLASGAVSTVYTATLPLNGAWIVDETGEMAYKVVSVSGILASDDPILDVVLPLSEADAEKQLAQWSHIRKAVSYDGSVRFYAAELPFHTEPGASLTVKLLCIRK